MTEDSRKGDKLALGAEAVNRPLRVWPAVVVLAMQVTALILTVTPQINNLVRFGYMMLGPAICGLLFATWFLFASRLPWRDRFTTAGGVVVIGGFMVLIVNQSMWTPLWIYGIPLTMLLVALTVILAKVGTISRVAIVTLGVVGIGLLPFALASLDGFDGSYSPEFRWRWQASPEQILVSREQVVPTDTTATTDSTATSDSTDDD